MRQGGRGRVLAHRTNTRLAQEAPREPTWYVRFFVTTPKQKSDSASSGNSHLQRALQMMLLHSVMSIVPAAFLSVCASGHASTSRQSRVRKATGGARGEGRGEGYAAKAQMWS